MGLIDFAVPLGLTLILEGVIALFWKFRRRNWLLFVLVNVLTNPAVVLLHTLYPHPMVTAVLELSAAAVEGFCYARFGDGIKKPWIFAATANVFSFCVGLGISGLL